MAKFPNHCNTRMPLDLYLAAQDVRDSFTQREELKRKRKQREKREKRKHMLISFQEKKK